MTSLRRSRVFSPITLVVLSSLAVLSCTDDLGPGQARAGSLAIQPTFSSSAAGVIDVRSVRISLVRASDGGQAVDTSFAVPAGADSVDLSVRVPVFGADSTFSMRLWLVDAAGDTVFTGGPLTVIARTGATAQPPLVQVPLSYVGPGASATSVTVINPGVTVLAGDTVLLRAEARDGSGNLVPDAPIIWRSLDTTRASFPDREAGRIVGRNGRGSVSVIAQLLTTGVDTASVLVQPRPSAIARVGGNSQIDTVGNVLGTPLRVRVTATDSLPVRGVRVVFTTPDGGSFTADTVTTDSLGIAATTWTLGTVSGPQTAQVSTPAAAGVTASFSATALAGAADNLVVGGGNGQQAAAGTAVSVNPSVVLTDNFGNPVSGLTVQFGVGSGGGAITGGIQTTDSLGVATVGSWTLGTVTGANQLVATVIVPLTAPSNEGGRVVRDETRSDEDGQAKNGLSDEDGRGDTRKSPPLPAPGDTLQVAINATAVAGAPAGLAFTTQPANTSAGSAITPAVQVAVQDQFGNLTNSSSTTVQVALIGGTPGAALTGTTSVSSANGLASYPTISVDSTGTAYQLVATATALTPDTSTVFDVLIGAPATVDVPVDSVAFAAFGDTLTLTATERDAGGNPTSDGIAWSTTNASIVTVDTLGFIVTQGNGTAVVFATSVTTPTALDSVVVQVSQVPVALDVQPDSITLGTLGDTITFNPIVSDANGFPVAGLAVSWSLSDSTVASIDSAGLATAILDGTTAVFGEILGGTLADTSDLTVSTVPPTMASIRWINASGGNWSNMANWDLGRVPLPTDTVAIETPGTYTVILDVNDSIAGLVLGTTSGQQTLSVQNTLVIDTSGTVNQGGQLALVSGGLLRLNGTKGITVDGQFTWTAGSLLGNNVAPLHLTASSQMNIFSAANRVLQSIPVITDGQVNWTAAFTMTASFGATWTHNGTMDITAAAVLAYGGSTVPTFINQGSVTVQPTGSFAVDIAFDNDGTLTGDGTNIDLTRGGNSAGNFAIVNGAQLLFSGNHTALPGSDISGIGNVTFSGGTADIAGSYDLTGTTTIVSGTANFNVVGDTARTDDLVMSSGAQGGTGAFEIRNSANWTGGSFLGSGVTIIPILGTLTIGDGGSKVLQTRVLENQGNTIFTAASSSVTASFGGTFLNAGTFDVQTTGNVGFSFGGSTTPVFVNTGTFLKATTGLFTMDMAFDNAGTMDVQAGTVSLSRGGTSLGGSFTVTGSLNFASGTHTTDSTTTITGSGNISFTGAVANLAAQYSITGTTLVTGGTANFDQVAGDTATTAGLTVSSGTQAGTGALLVTSSFAWTGGALTGTGTTLTGTLGTFTISDGGAKTLQTRTLVNQGSGFLIGPSQGVTASFGGTFINAAGATFDVQTTGNISWAYGGSTNPVFDNRGTLLKSNTGTFTISATFLNSATVNVSAGNVQLTRGGTLDQTFSMASGSELQLSTGSFALSPTLNSTGPGMVAFSGGTVTVANPDSVEVPRVRFAGGTLTPAGILVITDSLHWTTGDIQGGVTGARTLIVGDTARFVWAGTSNRSINDITLINNGFWDWQSNQTILGNGNLAVQNNDTLNLNLASGTALFDANSASPPSLTNNGNIIQQPSVGTFTFDVFVQNDSLIEVLGGDMVMTRNGNHNARIDVAAGSELRVESFTHRLVSTFQITGGGRLRAGSGTTRIAQAETVSIPRMVLDGGTLEAIGTLTITDSLTWITGNIDGTTNYAAPRTLNIASGAKFLWQATSNRNMTDLNLNNNGFWDWQSTAVMLADDSTVIQNNDTLNIGITGASLLDASNASPALLFNNAHIIQQPTVTTFTFDAFVQNDSLIEVLGGDMVMTRNGNHNARIDVAAGSELQVESFTHRLVSAFQITGGGRLRVGSGTTRIAAAETVSIPRLILDGGTLEPIGTLTITDSLTWITGDIAGTTNFAAPRTLNIASGAKFLWQATSNRNMTDLNLNNNGFWDWQSTAVMLADDSTVVQNNDTLNISATGASLLDASSAAPALLFNNAHIIQQPSVTTFTFDAFVQNDSLIEVLGGNMVMTRNGNHNARIDVAAGSELQVESFTHRLVSSFQITGGGRMRVGSGTTRIAQAETVTIPRLTLDGGTLEPIGTLTITDSLTWITGDIAGTSNFAAPRTLNIASGAKLLWQATSNRNMSDLNLNNNGFWDWQSTATMLADDSTVVQNNDTLNISFSGTGLFDASSAAPALLFNNAHIIQQPTVTTFTFDAFVRNDSLIEILGGDMVMSRNGRHNERLDVAAGSRLRLTTFTHRFPGTFTFTGGGLIEVASGTTRIDSLQAVTMPRLVLSGGTLEPVGSLTITDSLHWSSGDIDGTGSAVGSRMLIVGDTARFVWAGTSNRSLNNINLLNDGYWDWQSGATILANAQTIVQNQDTMNLNPGTGTALFDANQATPATVVNLGTVVQQPITSFNFDAAFVNNGVLDILGGTLGIDRNLSDIDGAVVQGVGTYAPSFVLNSAFNGDFSPGTSGTPGILNVTDATFGQTTASALVIDILGPAAGTGHDQLNITGAWTAAGDIELNFGAFTPANGDMFPIVTYDDRTLGVLNIMGLDAVAGVVMDTLTGGDGPGVGTPDTLYIAVMSQTVSPGTVVWNGLADNSWSNTGNWVGGFLPIFSDSVFINGLAANQPTLDTSVAIAKLTMGSGATLTLSANENLAVSGDVIAGNNSITGTGRMTLFGTNAMVSGTMPRTHIQGSYTANGPLVITDSLVLNAGSLTVGGQIVEVQGPMFQTTGGAVIMNSGLDSLTVNGDIEMQGGINQFDDGTLVFRGGVFSAGSGGISGQFPHTLVFDGASQRISQLGTSDSLGSVQLINNAAVRIDTATVNVFSLAADDNASLTMDALGFLTTLNASGSVSFGDAATLSMTAGAATINTQDISFFGGSTNGLLTGGTINVSRDFAQGFTTDSASFFSTGTSVNMTGATTSIQLSTWGASQFDRLGIDDGTTVSLITPIQVADLQSNGSGGSFTLSGDSVFVTNTLFIPDMNFIAAPLRFNAQNLANFDLSNVQFSSMPSSAPQISFTGDFGGPSIAFNVVFHNNGGVYVSATDDGVAGGIDIIFQNASDGVTTFTSNADLPAGALVTNNGAQVTFTP